ncbi:DUF4304 domain-containing protein [Sinorhizobium sp. BJ1]|uniref:DUF4304 domain-containing protein n=1 Tax=Sinorhizobium sp. BJ1 TaxID=2035455 RepID=UPI0032AF883A
MQLCMFIFAMVQPLTLGDHTRNVCGRIAVPWLFFQASRSRIALTGTGQGIPHGTILTPSCRSGRVPTARLPGNCHEPTRFAPMSAFERVIGQELAPYLRSVGFLRHGQTWNRRTDGVVQVISVQRSMNNTELDSPSRSISA